MMIDIEKTSAKFRVQNLNLTDPTGRTGLTRPTPAKPTDHFSPGYKSVQAAQSCLDFGRDGLGP